MCVGIALLLGCPATASAQVVQATASPASASCIDRLPPTVFTRVAVYASVALDDPVSATFAQSADNFLQAMVDTAQRLLGASGGKLPVGEPAVSWHGVDKALHLVAYKDGRIVVLDRDSINVGTTAALLARAHGAMSTIGQLEWSADSARDSVRFHIAFNRPTLDSAGHVTKATSDRRAVPVFSILAPWQRMVTKKGPRDVFGYPDGEARHYNAHILLSFIVDSTGHAVASTIRDLYAARNARLTGRDSTAYQAFIENAERQLGNAEFEPASIGGCPVPQLVQMPFEYKIH